MCYVIDSHPQNLIKFQRTKLIMLEVAKNNVLNINSATCYFVQNGR